jgi:membrane protease YdiL (CAAX protease family)
MLLAALALCQQDKNHRKGFLVAYLAAILIFTLLISKSSKGIPFWESQRLGAMLSMFSFGLALGYAYSKAWTHQEFTFWLQELKKYS